MAVAAALPGPLRAAAVSYNCGTGSANWYSAVCWSGGAVPTGADDVTIDVNTVRMVVNASSPAITFNSLVLGNSGATNKVNLTLSTTIVNGGSITIYGTSGLLSNTTREHVLAGNVTMVS